MKLTVLSGHSGAGKSTLAAAMLARAEGPCAVLGYDAHKLPGGSDTTLVFLRLAAQYAAMGLSVIVDGVNLHRGDEPRWAQLGELLFDAMEWVNVATPVEECIARDARRPYPVGEAAIRRQGQDWEVAR